MVLTQIFNDLVNRLTNVARDKNESDKSDQIFNEKESSRFCYSLTVDFRFGLRDAI